MGICDKIVFVAPMDRWLIRCKKAGVSESADEADSKSVDGNIVRVQVPPPAKIRIASWVERRFGLFICLDWIERRFGLFS